MHKFRCVIGLITMCFFTTEVSALMRVDIPKKTVQGSVIRVLIQDQAPGMHKVHFCPVGWSESRKCVEFDPVSLDNGNDFVLIPIGVDETPGMAIISVFSVTSAYAVPIIIEKVNFEVAKGVTFVGSLTGKLKLRFDSEKAKLNKIFSLITKDRFWNFGLKFSAPLKEMAITSPFGQIRRKVSYLYGKWNTNHYGVDLRADVGTPVFAVEGGIVRVADNWLAEGNVVIIDHGYGLFSLYFHLSRLKVKSGEVVGAGQIIALSGQSGAAKGPHLHFEMRLNGIAISPWNFMPEAQIYEVKK